MLFLYLLIFKLLSLCTSNTPKYLVVFFLEESVSVQSFSPTSRNISSPQINYKLD